MGARGRRGGGGAGGLDALINVAAMPLALHAADDAAADAAAALGAVATSVALGTAAAARRMASQPTGGHVLNVATLGALAPAAECALSHAAAAAARAYSVVAAKDLAPKGVRVTALITDAVRTPALEAHVWRDEAATGFVGGTISPEQFELAAARALLRRPVEMRCAASPFRALRVVVANALPGCLLVDGLIAYFDRRAGHAAQAEILRERVEDHEEKVQVRWAAPLTPTSPYPSSDPTSDPASLPLQRLNAPGKPPLVDKILPVEMKEEAARTRARLIWVRRRLVGAYGWKAALAALAAAAAADGALTHLGRRDDAVDAALAVCALLARVPAAVAGAVVDGIA